LRDWIDAQARRGDPFKEEVLTRLDKLISWIELRQGKPDGNTLLAEGGGLCSGWFWFDERDWEITYYVTPDGEIVLLTVFEITSVEATEAALAAARLEMQRCVALQHRVEDL
jgi:hypothetical protein